MRSSPLEAAVRERLSDLEDAEHLEFLWTSAKTCIQGLGFLGCVPRVFVKLGRSLEQATESRRVFSLLSVLRMEQNFPVPAPHCVGVIPGYGPILVVDFIPGAPWQVGGHDSSSRRR